MLNNQAAMVCFSAGNWLKISSLKIHFAGGIINKSHDKKIRLTEATVPHILLKSSSLKLTLR